MRCVRYVLRRDNQEHSAHRCPACLRGCRRIRRSIAPRTLANGSVGRTGLHSRRSDRIEKIGSLWAHARERGIDWPPAQVVCRIKRLPDCVNRGAHRYRASAGAARALFTCHGRPVPCPSAGTCFFNALSVACGLFFILVEAANVGNLLYEKSHLLVK